MKKFFGFGPSTPPPPPPPAKPPSPSAAKPARAAKTETPPKSEPPKSEPPKTQPAPATPPPAPSIVGRWKDPNSGDITEFHADGAVTENVSGDAPIRGRYSLAGDKLKLNLEGVPDELSFPITIKAETLEMVDAEGQMTRYQRVK